MASESEISDLYITLRTVTAPMLEGFTQASAAGEEMVAALTAGLGKLDAAIARTAEQLAGLRTEMASAASGTATAGAAAGGETAATGAAASAAAAGSGAGAAADADAAATEAASAKQVAAWDRVLAEMAKVSAESATTAASWDADMTAMVAASTRASEGMIAAQSKVEASNAQYAESAAAYDAANAPLSNLAGNLLKVGAAGVIAGGATVKMAADFQSSTTRLVTSGGELQSNLATDQQGILNLAGQVGYSAGALSSAMYKITSSGQQAGQALDTLKAAAQGAKTENADLTTVADAVSTVMIDYHGKVGSAADVTSKLVAATSQGKTNFQDLASSLSAILPKASGAHISLDEILGDLASMTQHGMSAQQAAQNLANAVGHLQSPTMAMSKEMAALGINSTELAANLGKAGLSGSIQVISQAIQKDMGPGTSAVILQMQSALKGLPPAVQQVSQEVLDGTTSWAEWNAATKTLPVTQRAQAQSFATLVNSMHTIGTEQLSGSQVMQTYAGAMNKAMGTTDGLNVALMLTGQNTDNTNRAIAAVSKATADAQGNVQGWSNIQGTFNQQLSEAKDGLDAAAIAVGEKLLPPATALVGVLAGVATWLAHNTVAADALAVVIGILLAGGVVGLTMKLGQFALAMAKNVIAPITGAVGFTRNLIGGFQGAEAAAGTFGGKVASALQMVGSWASSTASAVASFVSNLAGAVASGAQWVASTVAQWATVAASAVVNAAKSTAAWLASTAKMIAQGVAQAATWAASIAAKFVAVATSAVVNAAATSAAWLAASARMVAQGIAQAAVWVAGMLVKFAVVAASAVVSAAATAAAWIAANAAMIVATGGIILLIGLLVAAGIWVVTHWTEVKTFFVGLWHDIEHIFSETVNWVVEIVKGWYPLILGVLSGGILLIPALIFKYWHQIVGFFSDAGQWLWNAGKAILDGLLNGLKSAWNSVTSFIGGIGSWIAAHKGPIDYDRSLLTPHGNAIMDGLLVGLQAGGQKVGSYLTQFTQGIRDTAIGDVTGSISVAGVGGASAGATPMVSPAGAASGSGVTVVNMPITVNGSVLTDTDLARYLQRAFLQLQARNGSFSTTVAFS